MQVMQRSFPELRTGEEGLHRDELDKRLKSVMYIAGFPNLYSPENHCSRTTSRPSQTLWKSRSPWKA
ncbi:unnamed protein product [Microthlaspi erraticum]|uniref:Uncharacterized protein n=1 Tax=Microthlaspi erraticum TaxID=1685480 RepID=A0A6D2JPK5_9BRAS|nr:unnamed protein product [Microthlaspi erraticum]